MDKPRSSAPIIAAVLLLLTVLYVGSYLAMVKPGGPLYFVGLDRHPTMRLRSGEYYRLGGDFSAKLFWPLEQIDRRLRPRTWESPFQVQTTSDGSGFAVTVHAASRSGFVTGELASPERCP